jgi:hypothetical protein
VTTAITRRLQPVIKTLDPWGGAWGSAWGGAWGTPGFSLGLLADNTARISGAPTRNPTSRIQSAVAIGGTITRRIPDDVV